MENQENQKSSKEVGVFKGVLNQNTKDSAARIIELVKTGEVSPSYVGIGLKKMSKIFERIKEDKGVWEMIEADLKTHQEGTKKSFNLYGAKITVASTGFWDYSETEDPVLQAYNEIEAKVKELKKLREEYIQNKSIEWEKKNSPSGGQPFGITPFTITWDEIPKLIFEEAVGEVQTNPATKKGRDTLRFSL